MDGLQYQIGTNRMVGVDWIHLAQGRDRLWAVVDTVMNFGLHTIGGGVDFLCSWRNC